MNLITAQQEALHAWASAPRPHPGMQITTLLEASYQADHLYRKIAAAEMRCPNYQKYLQAAGSVLQLTREMIARQLMGLGYTLWWSPQTCEYLLRDRDGAILVWQTILNESQRERIAVARSGAYEQENRTGGLY